jgi:hypothetical protein
LVVFYFYETAVNIWNQSAIEDASRYPSIAMMGGRPPPWMGLTLKLLPRGRDPSNGRFRTSSAGAASGAYTNHVSAVRFQAWTTGRISRSAAVYGTSRTSSSAVLRMRVVRRVCHGVRTLWDSAMF